MEVMLSIYTEFSQVYSWTIYTSLLFIVLAKEDWSKIYEVQYDRKTEVVLNV